MASWQCCGVYKYEEVRTANMADVLVSYRVPADPDVFTQLLAEIDQTLEGRRVVEKVRMSKEVENFASYLEKHLSEGISAIQVLEDAISSLENLPWVGAGLTIIAMGLNMTLKTHENRQLCLGIMKESLDIWKKVMQPVLETRGSASDSMGESINIIIEGYLYCKNLLNSRTWKRFICASNHERDLETWKKKQASFLLKANTVMIADVTRNLLPRTLTLPKTSATILVGLEDRRKDVLKKLLLEDMEEIRAVILHGMGGVGKSTLAEVVYNQAVSTRLGRRRRCCRIKVGEKPSKLHITSLQRKMVEDLTGESLQNMERDETAIEDKWRQVLLREGGEPLFIYMDNVLERGDLEDVLNLDCERIRIPKGSRLLITTRDVSVCNEVFERNGLFNVEKINVKVLNDEDAKMLFFLHAFGEKEPSMGLVERYDDGQGLIVNMVSSICGNLPLALRVLGRSLTNKNVNFWRNKYNELKLSQDSDFEGKVTNVLKSSYNTLNSEAQIAFLIACVNFHNHNIIQFRDCVRSLLPKANPTRLFELGLLERDLHFLENYENLCFCVKIHDLVRNLGYELAIEMKCAFPTMLTSKEDFLNGKDESWSELKWLRVPELEDGIDAKLFEKCKELEILVLHTHVNGHIENPPQHLKAIFSTSSVSIELDKLKELVVWGVGNDMREEFPVTPSASALQVFHGFQGPHITEDAIDCHKTTLRKLICQGIVELSSYFCEKMTKLQRLELYYEGNSFPKELGSLVGLEDLFVKCTTVQEVPQSLVHLKRLQSLKLDLQNLKEIPSGVLGAMSELVWLDLTLGRVKSMPMQDIGQLACLEVLRLDLPSVERLSMKEDGVSLLKLEKLRWLGLWSESMSSLGGVSLSSQSLECLVLSLTKLEVLPSAFITGATKLRSVSLQKCDCLQELPAGAEMLGAVESLLVWDCPALKALPEGFMKKRLESLAVVGCGGMGRLPGDVVERAGGMRLLLCDAGLLPPHLMPLPGVLPFTAGDRRAHHRLQSFNCEEFLPLRAVFDLESFHCEEFSPLRSLRPC